MSISKSILAFAAVLSAAATVQSAQAAQAVPEAGVPRMTVRYGDLDLSSRSGVVALYNRLEAASRSACASYGEGNSIADRRLNKSCRDDLVSQGVEKMHSRALTALATNGASSIQLASH